MKKYIIFIFCSLLSISCKNNKNYKIKDNQVVNIELARHEVALTDTTFFESARLVRLETNDDCLIRDIDRIFLCDGKLVVFDDAEDKVFIFDDNGKFLKSIGKKGSGPQEYDQISEVVYLKKQELLCLLCDRPYKTMYFDLSGNFIKEVSNDTYYQNAATQYDRIICMDADYKGNNHLYVYDYPMKLQCDLEVPKNAYFHANTSNTTFQFSKGQCMTSGDEALFSRPYLPIIYGYEDGIIHEKYRVDFGEYWLPLDLLENNISPGEFLQICMEKGYRYTLENMVETSRYLLANTNSSLMIYDKKEKYAVEYAFILNTIIERGTPAFKPVPYTNCIAQVEHVDKICESIEWKRKMDIAIHNEKLLQLYEELDSEDNPIVILYTIPE